jgi:hypothetical protein
MATGQLMRDVILPDGNTLRLRAPSPANLDDIKAFCDALSPESRYLRFHGDGTDTAAPGSVPSANSKDPTLRSFMDRSTFSGLLRSGAR